MVTIRKFNQSNTASLAIVLIASIFASCTNLPQSKFHIRSSFNGQQCQVVVSQDGAVIYSYAGEGRLDVSNLCANCNEGSTGNGLQLLCSNHSDNGGLEFHTIRGNTLIPPISEIIGKTLPVVSRPGRLDINSFDFSLTIPRFRNCGWMLTGSSGTLKISLVASGKNEVNAVSDVAAVLTVADGLTAISKNTGPECSELN